MRGLAFLLKFSYRNLWRSPKRTLIMLLSLSLGSGFILWDLNFANSGSKEVMKEFLSQYAGIYHITQTGYYEQGNPKKINTYKTLKANDVRDQGILAKSTPRVTAPVFISGEKKTLGVFLTGLDVDKEKRLNSLHKVITEGKFLDSGADRQLIVGKKFAQRINIKLGDEVGVIGQGLDGSVANDLMTVVGLLDFGGGDLEESLAFTQIHTARTFLSMDPESYHQRVSFDVENDEIPVLSGLTVTHWTELLPEIGVSVKFIDNFTWAVSIVIVLVISLGLSNTIMITFFEREQEFQCLNIIGAKSSWVCVSLVIEVFLLASLAIAFGTLIGHGLTTYCYYYPINITDFTGGQPIIMGGMVIQPLVKLYPVLKYYWQVPLMIYFFMGLTMIYPLMKVIRRSKHAI